MKKIVQMLLTVCMIVLSAQVAFANADKVTIQEGADITTVKRIAIAAPLYTPVDEKAPNKEMLTQIVADASWRKKIEDAIYEDPESAVAISESCVTAGIGVSALGLQFSTTVPIFDSYPLTTI